jgi:hypothetical protein
LRSVNDALRSMRRPDNLRRHQRAKGAAVNLSLGLPNAWVDVAPLALVMDALRSMRQPDNLRRRQSAKGAAVNSSLGGCPMLGLMSRRWRWVMDALRSCVSETTCAAARAPKARLST